MDAFKKHVVKLERDGYCIIPNALSADDIAATLPATEELLLAEEDVARHTGTQADNLRVAHAIVGKHPVFYEFFLNPPVLQVVRNMIGDDGAGCKAGVFSRK